LGQSPRLKARKNHPETIQRESAVFHRFAAYCIVPFIYSQMKIVAAVFIVTIILLGLYNSYKKYKNQLLPTSVLVFHLLIGLLVIAGSFYFLFE